MKCQECQERQATHHFTQIVNGNLNEVHVCDICAEEKGYTNYLEDSSSLQQLLTGLFNFDTSNLVNQVNSGGQQTKELTCPDCGMTLSDFKRVGKFGCSSCYETFSESLEPILRRIHAGNSKHTGKIPKRIGNDLKVRRELDQYKKELQHLIEIEAFEDAAKIRDKIKVLENDKFSPGEGERS